MEIIEQKENKISFRAKINESLANALRRYVNQILITAVDEVEISKNDSSLYDETIAHRIGLIPIINDKKLKDGEKLTLDIKKEGIVYSGDLKGKLKIVYDKMPITILNKNQELKLVAKTKKGIGKEHSKFSPGLIYYRNIADIKIDKSCPEEVVNHCPKKIIILENGRLRVKENSQCDLCEECVEFCKKKGKPEAIKIEPTDELKITVESFGQIKVKEILNESIKTLKKDISNFSKKLK